MSDKLDVCSAAYVWLMNAGASLSKRPKIRRTFARLLKSYHFNLATQNGDLTDAAQAIADNFDDVDDVINALEDAGVFS